MKGLLISTMVLLFASFLHQAKAQYAPSLSLDMQDMQQKINLYAPPVWQPSAQYLSKTIEHHKGVPVDHNSLGKIYSLPVDNMPMLQPDAGFPNMPVYDLGHSAFGNVMANLRLPSVRESLRQEKLQSNTTTLAGYFLFKALVR